jgi:hypothetical protein
MRQSKGTPVPIEVGSNWGHGTGVPAELISGGDPSILAQREHLAMARVQMADASHLLFPALRTSLANTSIQISRKQIVSHLRSFKFFHWDSRNFWHNERNMFRHFSTFTLFLRFGQ